MRACALPRPPSNGSNALGKGSVSRLFYPSCTGVSGRGAGGATTLVQGPTQVVRVACNKKDGELV